MHTHTDGLANDFDAVNWGELYPSLRALARYLVYFKVPSWQGQEYDIVEDIVQETIYRLVERMAKVARGEVDPVQSLPQMMSVVASNYYRDLKRHDRRVVRLPLESEDGMLGASDQVSLFDAAVENVYHEQVFAFLAHAIRDFPTKQRRALLIDLANCMYFEAQPTPLQAAFQREGIHLRQHKKVLPLDPRERSRHVSLLYHAYRRVAHLSQTFMRKRLLHRR